MDKQDLLMRILNKSAEYDNSSGEWLDEVSVPALLDVIGEEILTAQYKAEQATIERILEMIGPCGDSFEDAITNAIAAEIRALPSAYKEPS